MESKAKVYYLRPFVVRPKRRFRSVMPPSGIGFHENWIDGQNPDTEEMIEIVW